MVNDQDLSIDDLEEFVKMKVEEYILEHSGDYELDVSDIEFKPFIDEDTGKTYGNA